MENQHRKITGYRELSQVEIDLMNEIKATGVQMEGLVSRVVNHLNVQYEQASDEDAQRLEQACPVRWLSLAAEHMQQGLMCLTRVVAQPTTF